MLFQAECEEGAADRDGDLLLTLRKVGNGRGVHHPTEIHPPMLIFADVDQVGSIVGRGIEQLWCRVLCSLMGLIIIACGLDESRQGPLDSQPGLPISVSVADTLARLIEEEDTDGDRKITIDDLNLQRGGRGDKRFWFTAVDGQRYFVAGTYYLSNLLQELKLAQEPGQDPAGIDRQRIFEDPVQRISRLIRDHYWDALTRRVDRNHLDQILLDEKLAVPCAEQLADIEGVARHASRYLYVPSTDPIGLAYFRQSAAERSDVSLTIVELPPKEEISPGFVQSLGCRHGPLSLALEATPSGSYRGVPFVAPGGRYNEMYGWDSYFESLGLLEDGRVDLARAMVDNLVYQITHYGMILNANRTYYLTRSQPPFLTSMALEVYRHLPEDNESRSWLKNVFRSAITEYEDVWMKWPRFVPETGLSRYYGSIRESSAGRAESGGAGPGLGPPPEVEEGHFDPVFEAFAAQYGLPVRALEEKYRRGEIRIPDLDEFFINDSCVRESGHDTTYRWSQSPANTASDPVHDWNWRDDRCHDFVTVDLNSLLYKIEMDIARTLEHEFGGRLSMPDSSIQKSSAWYERARDRRARVNEFLWNDERGFFLDYNFKSHSAKARAGYLSAAALYPLWAGLATPEQAQRLVDNALPQLEAPGGVAASAERSRRRIEGKDRQWDYPYGWPPHQMMIWEGLRRYSYGDTANRLIYRWLYMITRNAADYNGTIPEKFDVVARSHQVFAEYGNVGTQFDYLTREGFGWMNASYQVGLNLLPDGLRESLEQLTPPEQLFDP